MAKKRITAPTALLHKSVEFVPLAELDFDAENPRFGLSAGKTRDQTEILDFITTTFGIDDVISSIAVNGFFLAEPMICRSGPKGRWTVVEGNRRLAACLILAGDSRAVNQARKTEQYQHLQQEAGRPQIDAVPTIQFAAGEQERDLLSYLGVRHIAASQGWDSFAKAAWIARVVERNDLSLKEIALMTGDQHRTIKRLLEGFYVVTQLIDDGDFVPETSLRKGRGSNIEFPFSWVYTLLGYPQTRRFIGLPDEPTRRPLLEEKKKDASTLLVALFGDRTKGRSAAIEDSREIGDLASILGDQEKVDLLKRGKNLDEIEALTQPIADRLHEGLSDCREILSSIAAMLSENTLLEDVAERNLQAANKVRMLARNIYKQIQERAEPEDDEEESRDEGDDQ